MPLTKSNIEYIKEVNGYCWNVITGCFNKKNGVCKLPCWAEKIANRYKKSFNPTFHFEKLLDPIKHKKPARIWVSLTGDIFSSHFFYYTGECSLQVTSSDEEQLRIEKIINPEATMEGMNCSSTACICELLQVVAKCPQHTFLFLTKRPEFYKEFKFPENCWLGTTVNYNEDIHRIKELQENKYNKLWVSFEPLYENMDKIKLDGISWVILGGQTQPKVKSNTMGTLQLLDKGKDIPIYIKDNASSGTTCKIKNFPPEIEYGEVPEPPESIGRRI
ncbi:MAG: DUF5131 family protein [bacterium]|nr:DUF5131 family protein [bacterium]